MMIVVEGTARIPEGVLETVRPAMEKMILASRAEVGCIDYAYSIDMLDPTLVRVTERWVDREALQAHFKTPHVAEWRAAWSDIKISDVSLRLFDAEPEDM
ncbi:MAG: putative quinol monooxygenase [Pseudomonadota bacterium]